MPHNSIIIIFKDEPVGAAAIARIKDTKKQIKSCVDCKGYRTTKKNQNAKYNKRGFGCG